MRIGWVLGLLLLAGCVASPGVPTARADAEADSAGGTAQESAGAAAAEARIEALVSAHRTSIGLGALEPDADLAALARAHSARMAQGIVPVGHDGFEVRTQAIYKKLPKATRVGENVSQHQGRELDEVPEAAFAGWLDSPLHRKNIEKPAFNVSGVGLVVAPDRTIYVTQLFVGVEAR